MSAEINWTFATEQWAKTMTRVFFEEGEQAVNSRTAPLPAGFKERLIEAVHGEEPRNEPY
jgi:hypothetical protein